MTDFNKFVFICIWLIAALGCRADSAVRTVIVGDSMTVQMFEAGAFPSNYAQLAAGAATARDDGESISVALEFLAGDHDRPQTKNVVVYLGTNDMRLVKDISAFRVDYSRLLQSVEPGATLYCVGLHDQDFDKLQIYFYSLAIFQECEAAGGKYISLHGLDLKLVDWVHVDAVSSRRIAQRIMGAL